MITTLAPLMVDHLAAGGSAHVSVVASPIWDIGADLKNHGITMAVYFLMGGTALVAAWEFFAAKNRTAALKVAAVGVVLMGLVASLPSLGVVSKDTINSTLHGGGTR
jgi:peptidoglycan/LPS O-acetylase OafA/YrhL